MPWWQKIRALLKKDKPLKVVLFNRFFAQPMLSQLWGRPASCLFLEGPAQVDKADVVVFHLPGIRNMKQLPDKRPGQLWVAFSLEPDSNYPFQADPGLKALFDITMSYRSDADIRIGYIWPGKVEEFLAPVLPKTEKALAVAFVSNNAASSGRNAYIEELEKSVAVDRYGKDRPNRFLEVDLGRASKLQTLSRYKFCLAFENTLEADYVTEKFYECFLAGTVPVYRGAPNVEEFRPGDHCYINAADFASPRELAEHLLYLEKNSGEYDRLHEWRKRPLRPEFLAEYEQDWIPPLLRLETFLQRRGR